MATLNSVWLTAAQRGSQRPLVRVGALTFVDIIRERAELHVIASCTRSSYAFTEQPCHDRLGGTEHLHHSLHLARTPRAAAGFTACVATKVLSALVVSVWQRDL